MSTYKLIGARWLRKYTAANLTPTYAATTDARTIANTLCDLPWVASAVRQATMTSHSNESQTRGDTSKTGLDWNVDDRESFDAAAFCADHSGGSHRAYANAACFKFVLPDMQAYPTLTQLKVNVTSDPYNASGARVVVHTNSTGVIPTDCATCRNNDATGAMKTDGKSAKEVAKRIVTTGADGSATWFPNTETATLSPTTALQLQKYVYVFVLKENYAETRANWLEGCSFAQNLVEITTSAAITGWADGSTHDCSADPVAQVEVVVCKGGVVPDMPDAASCGVVAVNVLASGTVPVQDAATKYVANIAQVTDELAPVNSDAGIRTAYARFDNGMAEVGNAALCHANLKRLGVGFCVRQNTDVLLRAGADASPVAPRSISMTASSMCIPFSMPDGFTPSTLKVGYFFKGWTALGNIPGDRNTICYGNGKFYIVTYIYNENSYRHYTLQEGSDEIVQMHDDGTLQSIKRVTYGTGRFMSVEGNYALDDGSTTWTQVSGRTYGMSIVGYAKGRFIGKVRSTGDVYQLVDGSTTWTQISGSLQSNASYDYCYGGGRFVFINSNGGTSYELVDGSTTLSQLTGSPSGSLRYGGGRFVSLASQGNTSYQLVDGSTTWTQLSGLQGTNNYVFEFGGGRFIVVKREGNFYELLPGSSSWSQISVIQNLYFSNCFYGQGRFLATASSLVDGYYKMTYELVDGSNTWNKIHEFGEDVNLSGIAFGDGRFLMRNYNSSHPTVYVSSVKSVKFNVWIRDGYHPSVDSATLKNPSLYYADKKSVGGWKLVGSFDSARNEVTMDFPELASRNATILMTPFVSMADVASTTSNFSVGTPDFYYNAISADADATVSGAVKRLYGAEGLVVPDITLIG